nr:helix-turn-helix transcriptional regulator [Lacticaseibacillus absianus]
MRVPRLSAADRLILDALAQLHAQRFLQGLSAAALAARMGVTVAQLAKIERVDTLPSLPTLQRYAEGLGLALALQVAK